ncbi:MAG: NUDIX hydrolase [Burkholderiales bacterium]|nr:NUDIX hydrolase [Burkholderiales bacterium]
MAINKQPGAWALIFCSQTGTFLLGKRSPAVKKPGVWNLFGGRIDERESPMAALLRELHEETGFGISAAGAVDYGGPSAIPVPLGFVDGLRQLHYYLLIVDREAVPSLNAEHTEYAWFAPAAMPPDLNRPTRIAINIGLIQKALHIAQPNTDSDLDMDVDPTDMDGDDLGS